MLGYDLAGTDFRRLGQRYLVIQPRSHHHTRGQVLKLSHSARHQVSHAVHQSYTEFCTVGQAELHRFLRDKFGLCGHNGAPGAALRQLVNGPVPAEVIVHPGQHLGLHKALDKCGFSRAHRTHHADINIAVRSLGHALINICDLIRHFQPFLSPANGKAVTVVCSTV